MPSALRALIDWAGPNDPTLAPVCLRMAALARPGGSRVLPGPTGEHNVYSLAPRSSVLCLAASDADRLVQLAAVLAVGSRAIWPADAQELLRRLPAAVQAQVALARDWRAPDTAYEAVLLHGSTRQLAEVQHHLSRREGAIVSVERMECGETSVPLERLVVERAVSINTAAAGGNASLMAIG